jgi:putative transposase
MKTLRRYQQHGTFFITVCTHRREPLLLKDIDLFWKSWKDTKPKAWAILPDHFHIIIDTQDNDISEIVHNFKITYSRLFRKRIRPGRIWQNRFWDHLIRSELDYQRHLYYIHFNPVKHLLTDDPFSYEHSSIRAFFDKDDPAPKWDKIRDVKSAEFGE